MPKIAYIEKNFSDKSLALIEIADGIIDEYSRQGFSLTLRQLYYQFVARDHLPNTQRSYNNLGKLVNNARLAGHLDWDAIEDRTRNVRRNPHWNSPADIVDSCASQFRVDRWETQSYAPEVWIEKDALVGVIEPICTTYDVPYFACRGYSSQSEQWRAGDRFAQAYESGRTPIVLHLGDHDPSGIDMTRDNRDRLTMFAGEHVEVVRLALNFHQVTQYAPPPNPAKMSDSRAAGYVDRYGASSWELDALEPSVLSGLIEQHLLTLIDDGEWQASALKQDKGRMLLKKTAEEFRSTGGAS